MVNELEANSPNILVKSWHQVLGGAIQFNLGNEGFSKDIATKLHFG
jgi:hypothetical protein